MLDLEWEHNKHLKSHNEIVDKALWLSDMCCSEMEERRVPGRYLTQQRSGAEKVGQFEEDDGPFELHFFSVQTKSEII